MRAALLRASATEGWVPDPPLLDLVAEALAESNAPRVAIVSRASDHALERVLARSLPEAEVISLTSADGDADRHVLLAARGPRDLIVDLAGGPGTKRRFQAHLFHMKPGGTLLSRIPRRGKLEQYVQDVQQLRESDALRPPRQGKDQRSMPERDRHALAASLRRLEVCGDFVVAVNDVDTLAKVRESETNRFLELRPDAGRVLERVPGVVFPSRCTLRSSAEDGRPPAMHSEFDAPELSLREYYGVVCLPRQVALHDNVVLPATYRHNAKARLRNAGLIEWAPNFVRRPDDRTKPLAGNLFYLDNQYRGHFGHALTEQISHLWGWRRAKELFPDLRALVFERPHHPMAEWEYVLLEAGGISRDEIDVASEPVAVESLVVASPMFSMPDFVHPQIVETYRAIGDKLESLGTIDEWPERAFLSRRGRRSGHNKEEIEQAFADAGFRVVYPEELALGDQVRLVRRAKVIAGFSGSGMFQIAFTKEPKHVILVGSETYTGTNEYMIASVLGHRLDLVLCRPDFTEMPSRRRSIASYRSNFTYDRDREGKFLEAILADL